MSTDIVQRAWDSILSEGESSSDEEAISLDSEFCSCGRACASCHDLEKQKSAQRLKNEEKKAMKEKAILWANRIYEFDSEDILDKKKREQLVNQRKTAVHELKAAALDLTKHQLEAKQNPGASPFVQTRALDRLFGRLMAVVADEMKTQDKLDSFRLTKVLGISFTNENADSLSNTHHEPSGGAYAAKFGGPESLNAEEIVRKAREKRMKRKGSQSTEADLLSTHTIASAPLKDQVMELLQPASKRRRVASASATHGNITPASPLPVHAQSGTIPVTVSALLPDSAPEINSGSETFADSSASSLPPDLEPAAHSVSGSAAADAVSLSVAPDPTNPALPIVLTEDHSVAAPVLSMASLGSEADPPPSSACVSAPDTSGPDPHSNTSLTNEQMQLISELADSLSQSLPESWDGMISTSVSGSAQLDSFSLDFDMPDLIDFTDLFPESPSIEN